MALNPTTQDKRGILERNFDGGFNSLFPAGNKIEHPDIAISDRGFAITGSTLDDSIITISDVSGLGRFGVKPNAALPVWFFDFGYGSDQPHPTLSRSHVNVNWAAQCSPTDSISKPGSTHSMTIDSAMADGDNSVFADGDGILKLPPNEGRKYFRYYEVYNDFLGTELGNVNFKTQRWQSANAQTTPYTVITQQGQSYRFGYSGDSKAESAMYSFGDVLASKNWNVEEEYHEVSSGPGIADSTMYGVLNGVRQFTRSNVDSHNGHDPSSEEARWEHYKFGNFRFWEEPGVAPWRANLLYVDDSWCRVYITDSEIWSEAEKKLEIQVPVTWNPDTVEFSMRSGQFSQLSGNHLWVVDNNDKKVYVGVFI